MDKFTTKRMNKGDAIRILRDHRQVALLKPRHPKKGELAQLLIGIEKIDLRAPDAELDAGIEMLKSMRDYLSDVAEGHLNYAEINLGVRKMAGEDLQRLDAIIAGSKGS